MKAGGKIALGLAGALLVTGVVVGQGVYALERLRGELDARSAEVAAAYVRIAERDAAPLLKDTRITPQQRRAAEEARRLSGELEEQTEARGRVGAIIALQLALRDVLAAFPAGGLPERKEIASLRKAMDKQAPVRGSLDAYNVVAKQWNDRSATRLGALTASVAGAEPSPLPLLTFDGKEEYETIIQI